MSGEKADEAAGEGVAGAGRVGDALERIGRQREEALLGEERRAVLALLDHDHARAPLADAPGGAAQVRLAGQLANLGVVEQHRVDQLDRLDERVARRSRSSSSSSRARRRRPRALLAHLPLQVGLDVGQEERLRGARASPRAWAGSRRRRSGASRASWRCSGRSRSARARRRSRRPAPPRGRAVSIPRPSSTARSLSPKSSPTTPTSRTWVKKLAASEKCTAEPPSTRSALRREWRCCRMRPSRRR